MSSREPVELDFFGMERDSSSSSSSSNRSQFQKFLHRQRSFRGIQKAISKIKPEILKSVIASNGAPISLPSTPNARARSENLQEATPLTIFYNGSVSVFNVPRGKAESILKIAVQGSSNKGVEPKQPNTPLANETQLIDSLNGDLPIARRKSLQRFLEKRKERLTSVSPYGCNEN